MGRRDDEDLPPIEVIGAEPPVESLRHVSVGGDRSGRARWPLVAGVVVALALVGSALSGDDSGDAAADDTTTTSSTTTTRPTTTSRPSTTTRPPTTTTTLPVGPVIPGVSGAALLSYGNERWTLVDLETGARTRVPDMDPDGYSGVPVAGGFVAADPITREAVYLSLADLAAEDSTGVTLGPADLTYPSHRADRVWIVDGGDGYQNGEPTEPSVASLVDLSGRVLRRFTIDTGWYPYWVSDTGALVSRGGRVLTVDESGVASVAIGDVLGADRGRMVAYECDAGGRCGVFLHDLADGRRVELDLPARVYEQGFLDMAVAGDGRTVLQTFGYETGTPGLWTFDDAGDLLGEQSLVGEVGPATWLPGDQGFLLPTSSDGLQWVPSGRETDQPVPLPALEGLTIDFAFVIPR